MTQMKGKIWTITGLFCVPLGFQPKMKKGSPLTLMDSEIA